MSEFEKAMNDYYEHFHVHYPYAMGIGFKGKTEEENIAIIRDAIIKNIPVELKPEYANEVDY